MEIESDSIISLESCNKYGLDHRRKVSLQEVKDFMDRGLMTRAYVLERFTEALVSNLLVNRKEGEAELSNIKHGFQTIRDPQTGYVSKQRFSDLFSNRFQTHFPWLPDALASLFGIVSWYASFPFPPPDSPAVDQDGFIRAISLLTLNPAPRFHGPVFGVSSGRWGPHSAWLVQSRGKDDQDLRRRIFRSLAVPAAAGTAPEDVDTLTKLPIPRFFVDQPRERRSADASAQEEEEDPEDPGQQVLIVMEEDERCIDLQDVLSECPPEEDRLTLNPLRESYEIVLPTLPRQPHYIHEMQIPSLKLVNLLRLLTVANLNGGKSREEELLEWTEILLETPTSDSTSYVSWQEFDKALCKSQRFYRPLSSLMSVFKSHVDA